MPEEQKPNDVVEITKRETVEIVTDGKTVASDSPLAAIFDRMEQGSSVEDAAKSVASDRKQDAAPIKQERREAKVDVIPAADDQQKLEATGLNQQLEENARKKAEVAEVKEEPKVEVTAKPDEVPEEELQVLQSDKPKTAKRIQALLERTRKVQESEALTKKELEARDAKLKEYETQLAEAKKVTVDPATEAAIKQQQEELAMLRRRYLLDKDPEIKSRFDDRIASAEQPIQDILVRNGVEGLAKIVKEEGGWLNFTKSHRSIPTKDGPKSAAEVAEIVLQNVPFADRQQIQAVTIEQIATKRERDRFFDEEQKKAADFFKRQDEENAKGTQEHLRQVEEAKKIVMTFRQDMESKNEWLKEKQVPADATAEQKAAIEDDNRHTQQIRQELDKALGVKDVPGMMEVVKNAIQYHQERREHARTKAAADALKAELDRVKSDLAKFKNASKTVNRPGSILVARESDEQTKKTPQSFEEALELIARQKSGQDE